MNIRTLKIIIFFSPLLFFSCTSSDKIENVTLSMKTTMGDITILLYDDTPVHRDNFIKLVKSGFYNGISFHRVINNFMIQAGDPSTRSNALPESADTLMTYTIPAEISSNRFHKRGAVAAAREGNMLNPDMRSSGTQFYIVQGEKFTDNELNEADQLINNNIRQALFNKYIKEVKDSVALSGNSLSDLEVQELVSIKMFDFLTSGNIYRIPEEQRDVYRQYGGVPRLDGTYTVFGEVLEGMEVVDRIAAVNTDPSDKPLTDIKILSIKISNE
ncbi:MAG: peptidylprolyl isomerase [Bacteroidetes bacterium]|nr:peptidylprolyl isomerase [Bacteroidota bacterium]